jgi:hypothetical protein
MQLDEELYIGHRPYDLTAYRAANRKHLKIVAAVFLVLVALLLGFSATDSKAVSWTVQDSTGSWVPNPACTPSTCAPEPPVVPQKQHSDEHTPAAVPNTPHNGFSCYYAVWSAWVYHAAARFDMTQQHDSAAKNEALDRLERLGDAVAMTKVCRPWQIAAGFKIAEVL